MSELAHMCLDAVNQAKEVQQSYWTQDTPEIQGLYWHWSGDSSDTPIVLSVLRSGTNNLCFVSVGQYGIEDAVFCENYGGFWSACVHPELPSEKC